MGAIFDLPKSQNLITFQIKEYLIHNKKFIFYFLFNFYHFYSLTYSSYEEDIEHGSTALLKY